MFNDNESPISLFSFQDIITSLTGIMIFFLLLLSLNILDASSQNSEQSAAEKELKLIREKNALLEKHIQEMTVDINTYHKNIKIAKSKDESALIIERFNLKKQLNDEQNKYEQLKRELDTEKDDLQHAERKRRILSEKLREIEEQLDKRESLLRQKIDKNKQVEEITEDIKKKKNSVAITIDSSINKKPVLVECSSAKIYIYNKEENIKKILIRHEPVVSSLIEDLMKNLRMFSTSEYYFVFLVKPSSVTYIDYLQKRFKQEFQNADFGTEPIAETEGVTYE